MNIDKANGRRGGHCGAADMPQYSRRQVFAVWALAVGPMAAIAWWWVPLWLPEHATPVDWALIL